jgi:hypothetical protein
MVLLILMLLYLPGRDCHHARCVRSIARVWKVLDRPTSEIRYLSLLLLLLPIRRLLTYDSVSASFLPDLALQDGHGSSRRRMGRAFQVRSSALFPSPSTNAEHNLCLALLFFSSGSSAITSASTSPLRPPPPHPPPLQPAHPTPGMVPRPVLPGSEVGPEPQNIILCQARPAPGCSSLLPLLSQPRLPVTPTRPISSPLPLAPPSIPLLASHLSPLLRTTDRLPLRSSTRPVLPAKEQTIQTRPISRRRRPSRIKSDGPLLYRHSRRV